MEAEGERRQTIQRVGRELLMVLYAPYTIHYHLASMFFFERGPNRVNYQSIHNKLNHKSFPSSLVHVLSVFMLTSTQ